MASLNNFSEMATTFRNPESPPTRPSSALSGDTSYTNDDSDVDSSEEEAEYIRPRVRASTIKRHNDQCLVCGAKDDLEVYRVILQHSTIPDVSAVTYTI